MAASEQQLTKYVLLHAKFEIGGGGGGVAMWNFCWYAWKFCCYTAETGWLLNMVVFWKDEALWHLLEVGLFL